jgi:hypothetical protein
MMIRNFLMASVAVASLVCVAGPASAQKPGRGAVEGKRVGGKVVKPRATTPFRNVEFVHTLMQSRQSPKAGQLVRVSRPLTLKTRSKGGELVPAASTGAARVLRSRKHSTVLELTTPGTIHVQQGNKSVGFFKVAR